MTAAPLEPSTRRSGDRSFNAHEPRHRAAAYGVAALGPIAAAGAQFLLSFQLLHSLPKDQFGTFSFLFVACQFCLGVSGALLAAPYPVLSRSSESDASALDQAFLSTNLVVATVGGIVLGLMALFLNTSTLGAALFALYGGIMLLRTFARAYFYARRARLAVFGSDVTYGVVLIVFMAATHIAGMPSIDAAYLGLLLSAVLGLLAFGVQYLTAQFIGVSVSGFLRYGAVWRSHSLWSVLGVVTTEGTANAHVYIVTLVAGPTAFAPLAATALLIRPVALAMNALTDFERPQLARQLADKVRTAQLRRAVGMFRLALLAIWVVSFAAALALLTFNPRLLFPDDYPLDVLWIGAMLWLTIGLVRSMRTPESVLLQAAGEFRILAFASVASCGISIATVALALASSSVVWSLGGVLLGELIFALGIWLAKVRIVGSVSEPERR